jgi:hypothetical protein
MSTAFSQACSARIEAARQDGVADAARQADLTIWGVSVQARAQGNTALALVEKRILTVLFALVLFFAAASTRLGRTRAQWILLGAAILFLLAATVILATFPIRSLIDVHPARA